jgi:hypothetical protein
MKQLVSRQGPAYLRFLRRVMTHHPAMLREALSLAAKGYHLRKITEQVMAVEHLRQYLAHAIDQLHEETAGCARESQTRLKAYVCEVVARVRREYGTIHTDFRPNIDDVLTTFARALDAALPACHLRLPRRLSLTTGTVGDRHSGSKRALAYIFSANETLPSPGGTDFAGVP